MSDEPHRIRRALGRTNVVVWLFGITTEGNESVLYSFPAGSDGYPAGTLLQAKDGSLYGVGGTVTVSGSIESGGIVFKVN